MDEDGPVLQCRRNPPALGMTLLTELHGDDPDPELVAERERLQAEGAELEAQRWPIVRETDWCGEWVSDEDYHANATSSYDRMATKLLLVSVATSLLAIAALIAVVASS